MFGIDVVEGAKIAYPGLLQVQYFISQGQGDGGEVMGGRVDKEAFRNLVGTWDEGESVDKVCYVCGPVGFNATVMDWVAEGGGDCRVLPSDTWVGGEALGGVKDGERE